VFSSSVIGASLEEENEDTQPPADNVSASASGQNVYEVIGTLNDKNSEKPSWVTEIIPVSIWKIGPLCSKFLDLFAAHRQSQ